MKKTRHPEELFDEMDRWDIGADFPETLVEILSELPAMCIVPMVCWNRLCSAAGIPAGALQLMDPPQPLNPG